MNEIQILESSILLKENQLNNLYECRELLIEGLFSREGNIWTLPELKRFVKDFELAINKTLDAELERLKSKKIQIKMNYKIQEKAKSKEKEFFKKVNEKINLLESGNTYVFAHVYESRCFGILDNDLVKSLANRYFFPLDSRIKEKSSKLRLSITNSNQLKVVANIKVIIK